MTDDLKRRADEVLELDKQADSGPYVRVRETYSDCGPSDAIWANTTDPNDPRVKSRIIARVYGLDVAEFFTRARTDLPDFARIVKALCEWEELDGTPEARHILKSALLGEGPRHPRKSECPDHVGKGDGG